MTGTIAKGLITATAAAAALAFGLPAAMAAAPSGPGLSSHAAGMADTNPTSTTGGDNTGAPTIGGMHNTTGTQAGTVGYGASGRMGYGTSRAGATSSATGAAPGAATEGSGSSLPPSYRPETVPKGASLNDYGTGGQPQLPASPGARPSSTTGH
jgi:hypothetical protein